MGALDEGHFNGELESRAKFGFVDLGLEETVEIEEAVTILLKGLGEDCNREGLRKTPLRVAKALREGTRGYKQEVKDIVQGALFPESGLDNGVGNAGGSGGLVVVRDIDLFSYCESCMLPFKVQCHVGYIPSGQRVLGLSKLSRVADVFAKRLQDPQRLADEVCSALHNNIKASGVAVSLLCYHIQFPAAEMIRHKPNYPTKEDYMQQWMPVSVHSGSGVFENRESEIWEDFIALLKLRGLNMEKTYQQFSTDQHWCLSRFQDLPRNPSNCRTSSRSTMIMAVDSILRSLGEDPSRKELIGTPQRFIQWLMNFERSNLEMIPNRFNHCGISPLNPNLRRKKSENIDYDRIEIRLELNLPFWALCEHHLLPFHGVVHIGYYQSKEAEPVQRSILQSIVHLHGCKLQVQERVTKQIAETVFSMFDEGVMVVAEASHICMISRGIEKVGSSTATIAVMGRFSTDPSAKAMFLQTVSNCMICG